MLLIDQLLSGSFSVSNIALLLCLERAKLQSLNSTGNMDYSKETLTFWKEVYRLFGGAAIRLFSGPKHSGKLPPESQRILNPSISDSNFAVPDVKVLRNCESINPIPRKVEPGIIPQTVNLVAKTHDKEFILAVDGKKISQGINSNGGDIDLWGHEFPKLKDEKARLATEFVAWEPYVGKM